jgi:ribosomal protein S18 acetylase RimI-like enzyme
MGCGKINLQIRASNAAVIGFYEGLGYTTEARVSMGKRAKRE